MYKQSTCDSRKNRYASKQYELHCKTIRHVKTTANSIQILWKLGMHLARFSSLATFVLVFLFGLVLFSRSIALVFLLPLRHYIKTANDSVKISNSVLFAMMMQHLGNFSFSFYICKKVPWDSF